jgi:hypothetical protein
MTFIFLWPPQDEWDEVHPGEFWSEKNVGNNAEYMEVINGGIIPKELSFVTCGGCFRVKEGDWGLFVG